MLPICPSRISSFGILKCFSFLGNFWEAFAVEERAIGKIVVETNRGIGFEDARF